MPDPIRKRRAQTKTLFEVGQVKSYFDVAADGVVKVLEAEGVEVDPADMQLLPPS